MDAQARLVGVVLFAWAATAVGSFRLRRERFLDVHRWETTVSGPEKLYAIVTHDKYAWDLREEAAMSLIRMNPRDGRRVGLEYLISGYDTPEGRVPGALAVLGQDTRQRIVGDIAPKLVEAMQLPAPPHVEGTALQPDPSIPFKDAAFGLLSHRASLAEDEENEIGARRRTHAMPVQTDFEARIEQQHPAVRCPSNYHAFPRCAERQGLAEVHQ